MDLQDLINKYEGYFIVNYDNYEVIYSKGYKNENGLLCYKISDLYKTLDVENQSIILPKQQTEDATNDDTTTQEQTDENSQVDAEGQTEEAAQ